ncbi:hypothetical protein [Beggiatoa leptomitoformis]|uniref:Uncharacterized protein n=1 Tax=Beggiatoa leptomitoformis TaxID=288004 RepID=A0A2N9YCW1_9GAMM|nr:hypothetical protein [Beggiatoa leptomitoformis]ALG66445.1 hypothetical protein AL038_00190 [Beggiatoa leptomitoformis]AUI68274.1 hypothetical protein BLE401_05885 [Beggiatoa leptomitoformis]
MKDKFLVVLADRFDGEGDSYGSLQVVSLKPPTMRKGKYGHEVQKVKCEPDLVEKLGKSGHLPCLCELELEMITSGGKAAFYATDGFLIDSSSGQFVPFLQGLFNKSSAFSMSPPPIPAKVA